MPTELDESLERDLSQEEFWHEVQRADRRRLTNAARLVLVALLMIVLLAFTVLAWWVASGA
jgi:hypothetical protein